MKKSAVVKRGVEKSPRDVGSSAERSAHDSQNSDTFSTELKELRYRYQQEMRELTERLDQHQQKLSTIEEEYALPSVRLVDIHKQRHSAITTAKGRGSVNQAMTVSFKESQLDTEDRGVLAKMVMKLFDHWNLSTEEQADLLGLAPSNRAALTRYRKGEPVGTSRDQYERVGHLLVIHRNLRALFPENRELAYRWMSLGNRAFDNQTPVNVIRERGFAGLLMVRSLLDRALVS